MLETLFSLSNLLVLPFWALMILLPRWGWTRRIMASPLVVLGPALIYVALVLPQVPTLLPALSNPSAAGVAALLGTPFGATVGWVHFLAFDLFVGRWAYLDAQERGMHPLLVSPILLLVFMFGPLGLVVFLIARAVAGMRTAPARVAEGN